MSDFIKKIFYVIIGMLIAVFIIGGALWFINKQFFTRSPFKEQETPITEKHPQESLTKDYYLTPQNEQPMPNETTSDETASNETTFDETASNETTSDETTSLSYHNDDDDAFFDTAKETINKAEADSSNKAEANSSSVSVNTLPNKDQNKEHTNHLRSSKTIDQGAKKTINQGTKEKKDVVDLPKPTNPENGTKPAIDKKAEKTINQATKKTINQGTKEKKEVVNLPKPTNPGNGTEPAIDKKADAAKANINKLKDNSLKKEKKEEHDDLGQLIQDIQKKGSNTAKIKADYLATEKRAEANYLIQMGSYQSEAEAERQKAHLLILNVPVRVNKVKVNDKDFFRVVSAKKFSKIQAEQIKSTLQSQHINSILIPESHR